MKKKLTNYPSLNDANILSREEMDEVLGGDCKGGCKESCKDSCKSGGRDSSSTNS